MAVLPEERVQICRYLWGRSDTRANERCRKVQEVSHSAQGGPARSADHVKFGCARPGCVGGGIGWGRLSRVRRIFAHSVELELERGSTRARVSLGHARVGELVGVGARASQQHRALTVGRARASRAPRAQPKRCRRADPCSCPSPPSGARTCRHTRRRGIATVSTMRCTLEPNCQVRALFD